MAVTTDLEILYKKNMTHRYDNKAHTNYWYITNITIIIKHKKIKITPDFTKDCFDSEIVK